MARKKAESEATATAPEAAASITKADAVRAALADGADSPADGVEYIKTKFGIEITPAHFSSYKSQEKAKAGKPPGRRGRAPRATAAPASAPSANGPVGLASSVEAIKKLVDQYGVEQVVSIARLFGK